MERSFSASSPIDAKSAGLQRQDSVFADLANAEKKIAAKLQPGAPDELDEPETAAPIQATEPDTAEVESVPETADGAIQYNLFTIDPDSETFKIKELVKRLVPACSPIHLNDLARQVASGLGYKRYGKRIQTEVQRIAESLFEFSVEAAGTPEEATYFWAAGQGPDNFSLPRKIRKGRKIEEISTVELVEIARTISIRKADPIESMAAKLGFKRLHETTRKRLEAAWILRLKS